MSNQGKRPDEVAFNTIVGKNIRYLRKSKKLTQSNVASAIGVSFQQIQKYEKGSNGLHSYSLYKVAHKVFNISMDVLADPQMIIKHDGFKDEQEFKYWEHQDELKDQATNWIEKHPKETREILDLEPKVIVGSLEKIKDQLKKDGIDPEKTILPTLRRAASNGISNEQIKMVDKEHARKADTHFDSSIYEEFEDEYPAPLSQLENDPKMRATYDAIIDAKKRRH